VDGLEVRPALGEGWKLCRGDTLGVEVGVGTFTVEVGVGVKTPLRDTLALPTAWVAVGVMVRVRAVVALLVPPLRGAEPLGRALGVEKVDWVTRAVPVRVPLGLGVAVSLTPPTEGVALLPPLPPATVGVPPKKGVAVVPFQGEGLGDGEVVGGSAVALPPPRS